MRLNAQVKGGFYPVAPEAVAHVIDYVKVDGPTTILDPCCGRGEAIHQIGQLLDVPENQVCAIELDEVRFAAAKALMPNGTLVGPADFLGCDIATESFGFAWVNPPFDDELGGGQRVEFLFLQKATRLLVRQGILCLVCPARVADRDDVQRALMGLYKDIAVVPFPEDHRPYSEVAILAVKRSTPVDPTEMEWAPLAEAPVYQVPPMGGSPKRFLKASYTMRELAEAMAKSAARKVLRPPSAPAAPRPPVQLGKGQRALVLAGGHLNRALQLHPGERPIVIKATPYKEEFQKSRDEESMEDGNGKFKGTKVTTVISERIVVCVRVIDTDGVIHTLRT